MVAPLVAGLVAVGSAMTGVYHVGKAVENARYWSEYTRNTGFAPKYPWRTGYYDSMSSIGASARNFGFSYHFLKKL